MLMARFSFLLYIEKEKELYEMKIWSAKFTISGGAADADAFCKRVVDLLNEQTCNAATLTVDDITGAHLVPLDVIK